MDNLSAHLFGDMCFPLLFAPAFQVCIVEASCPAPEGTALVNKATIYEVCSSSKSPSLVPSQSVCLSVCVCLCSCLCLCAAIAGIVVQLGNYKPAQRLATVAYRGAQFFGVSFAASMVGHSLTKYLVSCIILFKHILIKLSLHPRSQGAAQALPMGGLSID